MNVMLLNLKSNNDCVPHLGLFYVGTVLKKEGHIVQILELVPPHEDFILPIKKFKPDLIGFSIVTNMYSDTKNLIKILKRELPKETIYVCGGPHPTTVPLDVIKDLGVDFVVCGEGEYTMKELCEAIGRRKSLNSVKGIVYKKSDKIINTGRRDFIQNLDDLPIPDRSLSPQFEWYLSPPGLIRGMVYENMTNIMASRGCPGRCTFCTSYNIFGRNVRRRSVENVIKEIKYLVKTYNIKALYFNDDTFSWDENWVINFCRALKKDNIKIAWSCNTRVNTISEEMLKEMRSSGCVQVDLGVESGSQKVLNSLKKGITIKQIERAFKLVKKSGLRSFASFIVGSPGETLDDIKKTKELLRKIKPDMSIFSIFIPFPGSEAFEEAKKKGLLREKDLNFSDRWDTKHTENPIIVSNFSLEELVKIRKELENLVVFKSHLTIFKGYIKNPKFIIKLILILSRHPLQILKSFFKSITMKKLRQFFEDLYQIYNQHLRLEKTRL